MTLPKAGLSYVPAALPAVAALFWLAVGLTCFFIAAKCGVRTAYLVWSRNPLEWDYALGLLAALIIGLTALLGLWDIGRQILFRTRKTDAA